MNALGGKSTLRAGKLMMNWMPLIIPQIWARQPDIKVCKTALPTTAEVVAAVEAWLIAATVSVAEPCTTWREHGRLIFTLRARPFSNLPKSSSI